ncbi:MAG: helix-turn-helix transcriptional regulator [Caldilinea sp.]|nr:helix-turn-helix transcriptional regulator [Caldilinea sp.]MCB0068376.1 helix-turn-helix transcriptional regulator [Caldilineaceae bacterium]MCB0038885.1 helix-turn-helix transcriptional regulator [Caldilinea sp.]MCB0052353.1 helix-turn-helix transcriptional regulator [Caldilinea sp.]MCB0136132.1 helix-turn-helix transcriptional regulator [Caldilineaceae bacterium]
MLTRDELPACPVATTVRLIGSKWKLLILRNLFAGPNRYGELARTIPGISKKVLTENLRSMEQDGILIRTDYAEVPPRVDYKLSDLGETMRPIIAAMETWGRGYQEIVRRTAELDLRAAD